MSEWLVRLAGRERDLRCFATALRDSWRVTEEDGKFYLRSSRFEKLGDAGEVKRVADEFVDWADLHALVRFERYGSVCAGEVLRVHPDGSRDVTVTPSTGRVTIEGLAPEFSAGNGSAPSAPDLHADMVILTQRRPSATALRHLREEPNWYGYWKATEALGRRSAG